MSVLCSFLLLELMESNTNTMDVYSYFDRRNEPRYPLIIKIKDHNDNEFDRDI